MTDSEEIAHEYAAQFKKLADSLMGNPIINDEEEKLKLLSSFGQYLIRFTSAKQSNVAINDLDDFKVTLINKKMLSDFKRLLPPELTMTI